MLLRGQVTWGQPASLKRPSNIITVRAMAVGSPPLNLQQEEEPGPQRQAMAVRRYIPASDHPAVCDVCRNVCE